MVHAPAAPLAPLEALAAFRQQYPTFDTTRVLDELRVTDYARLDTHQQVYLDYTGGGSMPNASYGSMWLSLPPMPPGPSNS